MKRVVGRLLRLGQRHRLAGQAAQSPAVPVGEAQRHLDPPPALRPDGGGFRLQLLHDQVIEQRRVLQPAAVVMLEQVAHHRPAGGHVGLQPDEQRPLVRRPHRPLGQQPADLVGLPAVGLRQRLPNLLLPRPVVGDGEGHQMFQRHLLVGVGVEQRRCDGGELQALAHHAGGDEEAGGDLLLAKPRLAQGLEGAELVERVQRLTLQVLGQRILLAQPATAHHAGHRLGPGHALLLDQQFQRPETAPADRHLEDAGLGSLGVEHRADGEAVQQGSPGDVLGKLLDRDAGLDLADVGLGQYQLVEGDVARGAEDDLGGGHGGLLRDGRPGSLSPDLLTRTP